MIGTSTPYAGKTGGNRKRRGGKRERCTGNRKRRKPRVEKRGRLLALTPIAMGEFWVPSSSMRTRSAEISASSPACCAATVELCAATVVLISKTDSYKFIKEINTNDGTR